MLKWLYKKSKTNREEGNMKKLLALVLSVSMVICAMPFAVFADADNVRAASEQGVDGALDIEKEVLKVEFADGANIQTYTGAEIKIPSDKVIVKTAAGETLKEGVDYELKYEEKAIDVREDPYHLLINGIGKYTGTKSVDFLITAKEFTEKDSPEITIPTQNVGSETVKNVQIVWNNFTLTEGKDFDIAKFNNDKAGTQKAEIVFKGNFKGTLSEQYNVVAGDISDAAFYFTDLNVNYIYSGKAQEPGIRLVMNGRELVKDKDYTVSYKDNINVGTAKIVVTGIGDFAGRMTETFNIGKAKLADTEVTFIKDAYTATGKEIKPEPGKDFDVFFKGEKLDVKQYAVSYADNINIGEGKITLSAADNSNFEGTKTVTFKIVNKSVSDLTVILEKDAYAYTGSKIEPAVASVKDGDTVLTKDTDYTVSYGENINAGIGTVVITGKSAAYVGSKTVEFKIEGKKAGIVTGYNTYNRYWPNAAALNLKARSSADEEGFVYTANNPEIATVDPYGNVTVHSTGQAIITIKTYGTKEYNPVQKTVTINVKPRKPSVKVTSTVKKQIKVAITKVEGATKYKVKYGRNGVYYNKYITHKDNQYKTVYTSIKNRISGKTYYVKVRAYKTMEDGTKVWGNWTDLKKIKAK